jgi:hypothetical protein
MRGYRQSSFDPNAPSPTNNEEMNEDRSNDVPFRTLKPIPAICFVIVALIIAFASDSYFRPHQGRIVGFVVMMCCFCLWSAVNMLRKPLILLFVVLYCVLHLALCFIGMTDESYLGASLIPIAIADYALFAYALFYLYNPPWRTKRAASPDSDGHQSVNPNV